MANHRRPVNKKASLRSAKNRASKTDRINLANPRRGGIRL